MPRARSSQAPALSDRRVSESERRLSRLSGAAGIVGPILFLLVAIIHGTLRSDHDLVSMPISALAAGPTGWVQDANFIATGCLMIAFSVGLHAGLVRRRAGIAGPAFIALSGLGLISAGVFPATDAAGAFRSRPLHTVGAFLAFPGAAL